MAGGVVMTSKQRAAAQAAHPGQSHYRIFYKDGGRKVQVSDFWAKDDAEAYATLEVYRKQRALVDPDDRREYFYGGKGGYIVGLGNGLEEVFDEPRSWLLSDSDEGFWERLWDVVSSWPARQCEKAKYFAKDLWFWLRHYDSRNNRSHDRSESWSLDSHVLADLKFNVPLIKADKHGVPNEFCIRARAKMHEGEDGFDARASYSQCPNSSSQELELGERLWNEELDRLMLHIRLFEYYDGSGIIDESDPAEREIARNYSQTLPVKPGTDGELDYSRLHELVQGEWKAIWKWMEQYGRMLWT